MGKLYRKNTVILVIVTIFISLVTFGMRTPSMAGLYSGKPKPRPRAVLQNQIKTCKENLKKAVALQADAALSRFITIAYTPFTLILSPACNIPPYISHGKSHALSRASPSFCC
jgi:hypothetical protein